MKLLFFFVFFHACLLAFSQKPTLNFATPTSWPNINSTIISNDGKYIAYNVNIPDSGTTLVLQATDKLWKKEISHVSNAGYFTKNSELFLYQKSSDRIAIFDLVKYTEQYIDHVGPYKIPEDGIGKWIAFNPTKERNSVVVLNLFTGKEQRFYNVGNYDFFAKGEVLLMHTLDKKDSLEYVSLLDLRDGKISKIAQSYRATAFAFDDAGKQLVFLVKELLNGKTINTIRYNQVGKDSSEILISPANPGMKGMNISDGSITFSRKGDKIFFSIIKEENSVSKISDTSAQVDVLNYRDEQIRQSSQTGMELFAVFHLHTSNNVIRLQQKIDKDCCYINEGDNTRYLLSLSTIEYFRNSKRRNSNLSDLYLISTQDGSRKLLEKDLYTYSPAFSITGKYIIWYDILKKQWFTHNLNTKVTKSISAGINAPLFNKQDIPRSSNAIGIVGWLKNDKAVLIQDDFDIWQIDPDGINMPINITKGYGRKNNIQFRYMDFNANRSDLICLNDTLILSANNVVTKQNGFFKLVLNRNKDLKRLIMSSKVYYSLFPHDYPDFSGFNKLIFPLKAKYVNTYIFMPMSASEYPNLAVTTDFINFKALTIFAPQKKYNWYTSELIRWTLPNGSLGEGILYKPENFDAKKKYPLIFYYYEKSADLLNVYINPKLSNGLINIPWFVSNGYLVFVPDIYYKTGYPGASAFNSVLSAAEYLSKKSWIDAKHMGLQGHSFGGFETDFIVTRTGMFAAAASSAGLSNLISSYNRFNGWNGQQDYYETGQGRIGTSLWQRQDLYIKNSPILKANKVTTPILIMHNKEDGVVDYSQESEWYSGLVHLNKKVWMLSYDGEGHTIQMKKNQLDYSIRVGQFFDYYLKGAIPPVWMTRGIDKSLKGKSSGLEPDTSGANP